MGLIGLAVMATSGVADARTHYVNIARKAGGNGASWNSSFKYLRDALRVAAAGDDILVAKGTYLPDIGADGFIGDRELSFELKGVKVYGGFNGTETSISERDPIANPTILSGEIWPVTDTTPGYERYWSLHVVTVTASSTLDGVIIEKGRANGDSSPADQGGGCYVNSGSTLTLRNCVLRDNLAAESGGAVWGKVVAVGCTFEDNLVDNEFLLVPDKDQHSWLYNEDCFGGAIRGDVNATKCKFVRNMVNTRSLTFGTETTASGGAIYGDNVVLDGCEFDRNSAVSRAFYYNSNDAPNADARSFGGAIYGKTFAKNCTFISNSATSAAYAYESPDPEKPAGHKATAHCRGGAIHGQVSLANCFFVDNLAFSEAVQGDNFEVISSGGSVYLLNASNITGSVFVRNDAAGEYFTPAKDQNTFVSRFGGGMYSADDSTVPVNHCTFFDNDCGSTSGVDIYVGGKVTVLGNVFWRQDGEFTESISIAPRDENSGAARARISNRLYPSPSTETFNIVTGGIDGIDATGADADFGEPPSRTLIDPLVSIFADVDDPVGPDGVWGTADDGLRLVEDCEAIDMGHALFVPIDTLDVDGNGDKKERLPVDVASFARSQGAALDLGAYEYGDVRTGPEIEIRDWNDANMVAGESECDFGNVSGIPVTRAFKIKNVGLGALRSISVRTTGGNSSEFVVSPPNSTSLAPGGSMVFGVTFVPKAKGARQTILRIESNDSDESPFHITLKASALLADIAVEDAGGKAVVDDSSVNLGRMLLGGTVSENFTIRNEGEGHLRIDKINMEGADRKDFVVTPLTGRVVAPGGTTTFQVTCRPKKGGKKSAVIVLRNSDPDSEGVYKITVNVKVATAPDIAVFQPPSSEMESGAERSFGDVKVGLSYTKTFTIKNVGSSNLENIKVRLAGATSGYTLTAPSTGELKPNESTKFTVTFRPKAVRTYKADIKIASNDADEGMFSIAIEGSGTSKSSAKRRKSALVEARQWVLEAGGEEEGSVTVTSVARGSDGQRYKVLTVKKGANWENRKLTVQVSSDLVDWFSGAKHTTVLVDNENILQVRDNTPLGKGAKRFIRLK